MSSRGRGGFTLIEVLVAMVILAIGLLALEALGISAARTVVNASMRDRYASLATAELEKAVFDLRRGEMPHARCETLPSGDKLSVSVDLSTAPSPVVTVEVIPGADTRRGMLSPYSISSSVYTANPPSGGGIVACD